MSLSTRTLVTWSEQDGPVVDYPDNPHGPLPARTIVALTSEHQEREVLLSFDADCADCPIIIGLLDPEPIAAPAPEPEQPYEAVVDGRRVVLEGQDEIVLRCGKASITLRRNGRVVVRGVYVETRSQGVNRIKGGSVRIN